MSDMAYIMETQDPRELWLVEGENKFKVSSDMYWLLASNGADLPPTHHITELLTENARLRKLVNSYADSFEKDAAMNNGCGPYYSGEDWLALANDMRIELAECCGELGVEVPS